MKKIIITIFSLVLLLSGASVFASGPFNGQSGDCPNMGIGVYPGIQRDSNGCWTAQSVTASAGDTINVAMFYHNNTAGTLTNVSGTLLSSGTGPSTHYTFSGNMNSDQGSTSLGSVSLNLTSSQTLTYQSGHFMRNKTAIDNDVDTSTPNMDNTSAYVGSVPPGWNDYGEFLVVFKVGENNNYDNSDCVISNFTIDGSISTTISSGDSVDLNWNTSGCDTVSVSGPNMSTIHSVSGSRAVSPTYSGTYTITAYGNGSGTRTRTVYVNVNDNNYYSKCTISYFNASPASINSGGSSTLSWSTSNCTSASIAGIGNVGSGYGSRIVYPSYTTNYILNAYGNNGSDSDSVQVNVNSYVAPVQTNCAVTAAATNITGNSVSLNGFTNSSTTAYFEYGPTVNMGSITNTRSISSGYFTETVTGLTPNTIYYFRLASNCEGGGLSRGATQVFETAGGSTDVETTRTIIRQGTTIVGTASPIMLKIEDKYQNIRVGDVIDYTVTYKNISSRKLTHAMVQVILPKGVSYMNASRGTFSNDTNTLSVPIDDLNAGDNGVVYLQGRVDSLENNYTQVVTTALLIYTNTNTAQENAMAYVLNNPTNLNGNSSLGANAFFAGFFGMSLLGWLLLILIILIIILLTRRYFPGRNSNHYDNAPSAHH